MKFLTLHKSWAGLFLIAFLAACSNTNRISTSFQPAPDVDLEAMAVKYPFEYDAWADSVHGEAYLSGDENAPSCTDCHADPASGEIRTAAFQLDIPNRCGRCHGDETLMADYEISSDVYDTYLADYHGTTIAYYQAINSENYRYEAVCSDCHGSHAIYPADDWQSLVNPLNLQTTCQKCHHDVSENFTAAFGHYRPSRSPASLAESPVIFWVKLFYQIMIPIALGGMVGFIVLDIRFRLKKRKSS